MPGREMIFFAEQRVRCNSKLLNRPSRHYIPNWQLKDAAVAFGLNQKGARELANTLSFAISPGGRNVPSCGGYHDQDIDFGRVDVLRRYHGGCGG